MYQDMIREVLAANGYIGQYDPAHVEAWMRLEYPTLDSLAPAQFAMEVETARYCIETSGVAASAALAASFGLLPVHAH